MSHTTSQIKIKQEQNIDASSGFQTFTITYVDSAGVKHKRKRCDAIRTVNSTGFHMVKGKMAIFSQESNRMLSVSPIGRAVTVTAF